jgi:hypothetical protein
VPVQGPFRNRPLDVGGASPSELADRGVRHSEGPRDGRQCFVCLAPCNCLALLIAGSASAAWPKPATTRCRRRRSRTSWVRGYRLPLHPRPKHLDRPGYFVAWWPRRRRRLLHDGGLVTDPLQHGRGQLGIIAVEGGDHHEWQSLEKARTSIEYRPSNRTPRPGNSLALWRRWWGLSNRDGEAALNRH